jgi:hypothetical protein
MALGRARKEARRRLFGRVARPAGDTQIVRELQPVADVVEAAQDHGFSFLT